MAIATKILLRNDTASNWTTHNPILSKGEMGVEIDTGKFKFGDGQTAWNALEYPVSEIDLSTVTNTYAEAATVEELADGKVVGDIGVVKTLIAGDKYSYTCYVWDGEKWCAADGNYNASNVYFGKDLVFTQPFGKYAIDEETGSVTIPTKTDSMSLQALFENAYAEEKQPTVTPPSVKFTTTPGGTKEVGTEVTPTYALSFSAGSYEFGPATGVTVTSYSVDIDNDDPDTDLTTSTGSFAKFTVTDNMTNYAKVVATVNYSAGAVPKTNLGNDGEGQIKAGSCTASATGYTGYRAWFHGYKNGKNKVDLSSIDSDFIRGLTSKNGSWTSSLATTDMQQMFFAAPAGKVTAVSIVGQPAPQTVKKMSVDVKGANGYNAIAYDVFYVDNVNANDGSETFTITVTKA